VGFVMPKVEGHREIHTLYGPTDRKAAFPDASWSFLVRAARNLAAAVQTVHAHGHVVGDVNQGNVVVSRQATVRLIDCDSFQVRHLGHTYPCRVGVPLYTPPELQGLRLERIERTPDHDRFGLAVLVFQLLFMGRHPFTGRHPNRVLAVDAAIKEGLFAFGADAGRQGWEPPPFSLRLREVPARIARLFESAFGRDAAAGGLRPAAAEWVTALDELDARVVSCGDDPRHAYAPASGSCPWCRIENDGGPSFFFLAPGTAPDAFDLATTFRAIEAVRSPGPAPVPARPPASPSPGPAALLLKAAHWRPRPTTVAFGLGAVVVLGAVGHATWYGSAAGLGALIAATLGGLALVRYLRSEHREEAGHARERHATAIATAEAEVRRLEVHWDEMCGEAAFTSRRKEMEKAKDAFLALPPVEEKEWTELTERFREKRLAVHLRTFLLEFARIPGLGPGPLERLASRGVKTAADISPAALMAIPHIDLGLVRGLLLFKGVATRSFTFDLVTGIPGRDRKALEDAQAQRRQKIVNELQGGALELAELRRQALSWRDVLGRGLDAAHRRLAELRRDADVSEAPSSLVCRPR
jgi:DNA-binding helix-hairpin-helix protein with protein kinase domain